MDPVDPMKDFEAKAPAMMAHLTAQFIKDKEFNSRAKVRRYMKGVLDMLSVDSSYPPLPDGKKTAESGYLSAAQTAGGGITFNQAPLSINPRGNSDFADEGQVPDEIAPIPGADDNEEILEEANAR